MRGIHRLMTVVNMEINDTGDSNFCQYCKNERKLLSFDVEMHNVKIFCCSECALQFIGFFYYAVFKVGASEHTKTWVKKTIQNICDSIYEKY